MPGRALLLAMEACLVVLKSCVNCEIINGEIERKEGLNGKNKSLKKTIECALTPWSVA